AVFNLFTVGTRLGGDAARRMEAVRLAEAELESLKAAPYGAVVATGEPRQVSGQYDTYEVTLAVDEHDRGKTVTVTVLYRERDRERAVTLTMERGRP
ncbi:MAG: hypothetical protein IBX71_09285, partial [Candidatus Desulforudis sp.]|nr:hypothetical protein [Desulforudis sp.]